MSNQADITKKALLKRLKNNRKSGATPSSEEMQQWLNHSSTAVLKATTLGSFKKHRAGNVFPVNFFSEWACPLRVDSGASVDSFMLYSIGDRCVLFESVAVILGLFQNAESHTPILSVQLNSFRDWAYVLASAWDNAVDYEHLRAVYKIVNEQINGRTFMDKYFERIISFMPCIGRHLWSRKTNLFRISMQFVSGVLGVQKKRNIKAVKNRFERIALTLQNSSFTFLSNAPWWAVEYVTEGSIVHDIERFPDAFLALNNNAKDVLSLFFVWSLCYHNNIRSHFFRSQTLSSLHVKLFLQMVDHPHIGVSLFAHNILIKGAIHFPEIGEDEAFLNRARDVVWRCLASPSSAVGATPIGQLGEERSCFHSRCNDFGFQFRHREGFCVFPMNVVWTHVPPPDLNQIDAVARSICFNSDSFRFNIDDLCKRFSKLLAYASDMPAQYSTHIFLRVVELVSETLDWDYVLSYSHYWQLGIHTHVELSNYVVAVLQQSCVVENDIDYYRDDDFIDLGQYGISRRIPAKDDISDLNTEAAAVECVKEYGPSGFFVSRETSAQNEKLLNIAKKSKNLNVTIFSLRDHVYWVEREGNHSQDVHEGYIVWHKSFTSKTRKPNPAHIIAAYLANVMFNSDEPIDTPAANNYFHCSLSNTANKMFSKFFTLMNMLSPISPVVTTIVQMTAWNSLVNAHFLRPGSSHHFGGLRNQLMALFGPSTEETETLYVQPTSRNEYLQWHKIIQSKAGVPSIERPLQPPSYPDCLARTFLQRCVPRIVPYAKELSSVCFGRYSVRREFLAAPELVELVITMLVTRILHENSACSTMSWDARSQNALYVRIARHAISSVTKGW